MMMSETQPSSARAKSAPGKMTERLLAVQVLYGMVINPGRINNNINDSLALIKKIMGEELNIGDAGQNEEVLSLLSFYQQEKNNIIESIIACLAGGEQKWQSLETMLQIILCLGVAEIMKTTQPPAIVISAWVEVAKSYFADHSPKLIHGVLDGVNKKWHGKKT